MCIVVILTPEQVVSDCLNCGILTCLHNIVAASPFLFHFVAVHHQSSRTVSQFYNNYTTLQYIHFLIRTLFKDVYEMCAQYAITGLYVINDYCCY